jgi:Xaa-Pro aminopeptidase
VYSIVLKMQKVRRSAKEEEDNADSVRQAAEAICKAGAHWDDLHLLCHRVLCEDFIALGIFKGTVDEMLDSGISQAFFPHGLGEMLLRPQEADG